LHFVIKVLAYYGLNNIGIARRFNWRVIFN
jgi:hypothetical protein